MSKSTLIDEIRPDNAGNRVPLVLVKSGPVLEEFGALAVLLSITRELDARAARARFQVVHSDVIKRRHPQE